MFEVKKNELQSDWYDKEVEIGRIEKSEKKDIVITAGIKGDDKFVNVREWYLKDNEWHPSKAGITLKYDLAIDVIQGVNAALKELDTM